MKRVDRQAAESLTRVPPTHLLQILIYDGGAVTSLDNEGSESKDISHWLEF